MNILISVLLGAAGGNLAGALIKKLDLGPVANSISGMIGGGMGSQILQSALSSSAEASMASSIIGGIIGGMLVMSLVGIIKRSWRQANN